MSFPQTAESTPSADPVVGFYGPETQMWRINREAILLLAGPTALLLQLAHPHIAEAVDRYSRFQRDPFSRLRGTLRTTLDLIFGDRRAAERAIDRMNRIHARIRGEAQDEMARAVAGPTYHAMDPALLLWVQVTLVMAGIDAYRRWVAPLSDAELDAFWRESRHTGQLLGIPLDASPVDWPALQAYWARMLADDGPIQVTPTAFRLSRPILRPPVRFVPGLVADIAMLPAIGLLPPRIRVAYGLRWGRPQRALAAVVGGVAHAWVRLTPRGWRAMPQAILAERRARRVV